ncbi:MAG: type I glyceraldehyde-3-phosphate dehydrogenase [Candidatus Pacebacteria bacterium]|nr:type I glyceraldehyde-3-phosphate dehydrogenase [Candidatus Paceibacterota bacterium]
MNKTFGINGFGRIGRNALRVWWQYHRQAIELKAVNTSGSMDLAGWAHLLKYDSHYGVFPGEITFTEHQTKDEVSDADPILGTISIDGYVLTVTAQRSPDKIPWSNLGVEVVVESTGAFNKEEKASLHFAGGAKKVLISAPDKGGDFAVTVLGVNEVNSDKKLHSSASCTTNCVAPVTKIINDNFGIEKALLTTVHAYTDDQNLQDNSHKDLRRARGAAENIVPTSTGAAKAVSKVIPELKGIFDGLAIRVPTSTGSLSDITFVTKKDVTVEEVNEALTKAANNTEWQGILAVTNEPIVSSDIVGRRESSIVDLQLTQVIGGNLLKIVSWYDNEWGYSNRLIETAVKIS